MDTKGMCKKNMYKESGICKESISTEGICKKGMYKEGEYV